MFRLTPAYIMADTRVDPSFAQALPKLLGDQLINVSAVFRRETHADVFERDLPERKMGVGDVDDEGGVERFGRGLDGRGLDGRRLAWGLADRTGGEQEQR